MNFSLLKLRSILILTVPLTASLIVSCHKDKGSDKPAVASDEGVGNTLSRDELKAKWDQIAELARNDKQSYASLQSDEGPVPSSPTDCADINATFSLEDSYFNAGALASYTCDQKPTCRLLILENLDPKDRSYSVLEKEDLSTALQFFDGRVKTVGVSPECPKGEEFLKRFAAVFTVKLDLVMKDMTADEVSASIIEKGPESGGTTETEVDPFESLALMKWSGRAVSLLSDALMPMWVNPEGEDTELNAEMGASECQALFTSYETLFKALEKDAVQISETIQDIENLTALEPQARIVPDANDPEKDLWAISTSFQILGDDQKTAIGSGYIRSRGESSKVVARIQSEVTESGITNSHFESAVADLDLKKVYIKVKEGEKSKDFTSEFDITIAFNLATRALEATTQAFATAQGQQDGGSSSLQISLVNENTLSYQSLFNSEAMTVEFSRGSPDSVCKITRK